MPADSFLFYKDAYNDPDYANMELGFTVASF